MIGIILVFHNRIKLSNTFNKFYLSYQKIIFLRFY